MDSLVYQYKRDQIRLQVLSEAEDRKNDQFVSDVAEWLRLNGVERSTAEVVINHITLQFGELRKARRTVKTLLQENLRLALKTN